MPVYRVTKRIASSAPIVWGRISDITAWPDVLPTVSSVTPLGPSSLEVGARFRITQPKLRPAVWQVTELQPGRSFVWEARASGLAMWANHVVREADAGTCDLVLEFRFSGVLAPLVALFLGALTQRYIETEAASFQALAETGGGAAGGGEP